MNDQSFRTVFGEYITAPQLLETLGDCTVESVQLNMDSRAMTVRLRPAALLPSEEIFAAEELLRGALQLQRAQLFPHYAPELLTADAMPSVVAFLRRENMAVNGTFDDAVYAIEGNTLTVTLAHGGKSVLAATRVEGQLTDLIVRLFDRRVQVVLCGDETVNEQDERYIEMQRKVEEETLLAQENAKRQAPLSEKPTRSAPSAPRTPCVPPRAAEGLPIDLRSAAVLYGGAIREVPMTLHELEP